MNEATRALDALHHIPADLSRDEWHRVGRAAIAAGLDVDVLIDWSRNASNFKSEQDVRSAFRTITPDGGTGPATLFQEARKHGWRDGGVKPIVRPQQAPRKAVEPPRKPAPGMSPAEVWSRCKPATTAHGYIEAKQAQGAPLDDLRVVPDDDPLRIGKAPGQPMAGALVVPAYGPGGTLQSLQFIPPPGAGKKLNLPDVPMKGASFTVGTPVPGAPVYVCEGIGAAWACWQATGNAAVVAFGWDNVARVAEALRQKDPAARLIVLPDVGKEKDAEKIAATLGCKFVAMPQGWEKNSDVNDLAQRDGHDVLARLLETAKAPPLPLGIVFADQLGSTYNPPDELVQGLLTVGDGSMLYGDSNSGKTFLAIDLACAVARGVDWHGRKVEKGLVLYVASESPGSVRGRLQAYQQHHGCKVPNFAIVQNPLDLFSDDTDTQALIDAAKQLERMTGQPVRLIVGDTLARLSAGANENSGQDMGLVVQRFDRIRRETGAHFLMIHHSGKAAAAGARGWSGIRAAVDTEIEVTETPTGRCAEATKQRDLSTKGERIGFTLERVSLGRTKWGEEATSCVVLPTDAPEKSGGKRMGEVEGAVAEYLASHKVGIKKAAVVKHFEGRYQKANVYRAIRSLVAARAIWEVSGMVSIASPAA